MKKTVNLLSVAGIATAMLLFITLFSSESHVLAFKDFPEGQTRPVSIKSDPGLFETMTQDEKLDQARDWLIYTAAFAAGLSTDEISQSLNDLPAIRQGYLEPLGNFPRGESRQCDIGQEQVIALVPEGDADERAYLLSRIADDHRKKTGKRPDTLLVFDYKLEIDQSPVPNAWLTRSETLDGDDLFTEESGYFESDIDDREDLENFLKKVDSLTYAEIDSGFIWDDLIIGGRKIKGHESRGLGIEDVAMIHRVDDRLHEKIARAKGFGFSLDPAYDYQRFFDEKLSRTLTTQGIIRVEDMAYGRSVNDWTQLLDSVKEVSKDDNELVNKYIAMLRKEYATQSASYDSKLRGSQAGMTMFYTDLLAKLWAIDFLENGPAPFISDLKARPEKPISMVYWEETQQRPNIKIWFGPKEPGAGYQVLDEGERILFARNLTEIHASSSAPSSPNTEVTPNAQAATFVAWWRTNQDRVARFEPEYNRLNELLKWSLLVSWAKDNEKNSLLEFLDKVQLKGDYWFPDWVKQQPHLQFKDWDKLGFRPRSGSLTEQLDLLRFSITQGKAVQGIVSGGIANGATAGSQKPPEEYALLLQRRGGGSRPRPPNPGRRTGAGSGDGGYDPPPIKVPTIPITPPPTSGTHMPPRASVKSSFKSQVGKNILVASVAEKFRHVDLPEGVRLRGAHGEMANNLEFERQVSNTGREAEIVTKVAGANIGTLKIARTVSGFEVGWHSRDVDMGQSLARRISTSAEPIDVALAIDPQITAFIKLPVQDTYLVKLSGSARWMKLAPRQTQGVGVDVDSKWHACIADPIGALRNINVRWLSGEEVRAEIYYGDYVSVSYEISGSSAKVEVSSLPRSSKLEKITIRNGNNTIEGFKDPATGKTYFESKKLPDELKQDPSRLQRLAADHTATEPPPALRQLQEGDYAAAAKSLELDPIKFKAQAEQYYTDGVSNGQRLILSRQYTEAVRQFDTLIEVYGPRPELVLGKGVAQISQRAPKSSPVFQEAMRSANIKDRQAFFDEINTRLASSGLVPKGDVVLVADAGDQVTLQYHLSASPSGEAVKIETIKERTSLVYVQDDSGLNNIDWNVSLTQLRLPAPVTGNLPTIVKLPRGGIAQFTPDMVYSPDGTTRFKLVSNVRTAPRTRVRMGNKPRCDDDQDANKDCEEDKEVYVVVASNGR